MKIIDNDQIAFLPLRYILDNVLLTHQTIDWAKRFKQDMMFLKLKFAKVFDKVSWSFFVQAWKNSGWMQASSTW